MKGGCLEKVPGQRMARGLGQEVSRDSAGPKEWPECFRNRNVAVQVELQRDLAGHRQTRQAGQNLGSGQTVLCCLCLRRCRTLPDYVSRSWSKALKHILSSWAIGGRGYDKVFLPCRSHFIFSLRHSDTCKPKISSYTSIYRPPDPLDAWTYLHSCNMVSASVACGASSTRRDPRQAHHRCCEGDA